MADWPVQAGKKIGCLRCYGKRLCCILDDPQGISQNIAVWVAAFYKCIVWENTQSILLQNGLVLYITGTASRTL